MLYIAAYLHLLDMQVSVYNSKYKEKGCYIDSLTLHYTRFPYSIK